MALVIRKAAEARERAFETGAFDAVLPFYAERLALYLGDRMVPIEGHEALRAALEQHRDTARAEGVVSFAAEFAAVGLPVGGRSVHHVDWRYDFGPERPSRRSRAVYYCDHRRGRPFVAMVDYRSVALDSPGRWRRRLDRPKACLGGGAASWP